jgi:acetyl esterase/lipase
MRRLLLALTVVALITSACADTDADVETAATEADTTPLTSATSTAVELLQARSEASPDESSVSVVEDLVYRSTEPVPWTLDVYHSPALESGPVVVFFHGGRMDKSASVYESIGEAIAEQGE